MSNLNLDVGMRAYIMHKYNGGMFALWQSKKVGELVARDNNRFRHKKLAYSIKSIAELNKINNSLKGKSYPLLLAAGGIAIGTISGGAGAVFSGLAAYADNQNSNSKNQEIRARLGDEIWVYEMIKRIGKSFEGVLAIYIRDPFRSEKFGVKIHTERHEIFLR